MGSEMERREHGQGARNGFGALCRTYRVRQARQVRFLSAGCDTGFPVPRGRVGMQGRKQSRPPDASTP
jgi:hypothetical protein